MHNETCETSRPTIAAKKVVNSSNSLINVGVTVRAQTGLRLRVSGNWERPRVQLKVHKMGFQLLNKISKQINKL